METADALESQDMPLEWWGHKYGFVSGGFLGALSGKKKSTRRRDAQNRNERTAFAEEDQENLYNLVQVCYFTHFLKF